MRNNRSCPRDDSIRIPSSDVLLFDELSDSFQLVYDELYFGPVQTLPWGMEYQSLMVYRNRGEVLVE